MFEKKLQVNFFLESTPSNKFGMLKIDSFNKEENIESSKSSFILLFFLQGA
jgi:hypothetical protein